VPPHVSPRITDIVLPPYDPLNRRAAELRAAGHDVISLGQALPFFGPPASAIAAAREAIDSGRAHGYSSDPGLPSLRAILAERLSALCRTPIGADDLVITAGANHAFTLALATSVNPGDDVLLPAPLFTNHEMAVRIMGAVAREAPVADRETFAVRWSDIESALTPRTRAVVLCNPSNPSGAVIDAREGQRIVSELAARGITVLSDETYMHFVYGRSHWSAASAPGWRHAVVVVGSFSKSFGMMGWRVGYVLADAGFCAEAVKIQDAMIICAPVVSQCAAEGVAREDWHYAESFRDALLERRQALIDAVALVPALHWTPTDGALFGFVRVDGCTDSAALADELLERMYVVTLPGSAFGTSSEGHLRLSYGAVDANAVREAVRRIGQYLRDPECRFMPSSAIGA
jgi:aminotransferase